MKKALLLLLLLLLALPLTVQAQSTAIPCGDVTSGGDLPDIDEINTRNGDVVSGSLYTVSEQVRMPAGAQGASRDQVKCYPQWVRAYKKTAPASWNPPASVISYPTPGPTLRAKVGDVMNLTFLNMIDAAKFPNSDEGCDKSSVYPGTSGDQLPNCFAESVFTNVHYHGTHTSPNSTADNVFLTVRPSPRDPKNNNVPLILPSNVASDFGEFYKQCNAQLLPATTPKMFPINWKQDLTPDLQNLLMGYVKKYGMEGWFEKNTKLIDDHYWPQYFVGAYPYCFNLPRYTGSKGENALLMGQAPGTHWYHAHKHGSTTSNVMNGMTGLFIIEGEYDETIRKFYGANFREKLMVLQQLGSVPSMVAPTRANLDNNFVVNGRYQPVLKMAGNSVMMWRMANTSANAGTFFRSPDPGGLQWKQMAVDGVQLSPRNYMTRPSNFLLASGNRIDLLVKAPAFKAGGDNKYNVIFYSTFDPSDRPPQKPTAPALTLLTVEVTANGPNMEFMKEADAPKLPEFLRDITAGEINGRPNTLRFQTTSRTAPQTGSNQMINNTLYNGKVGADGELNHSAEWTVYNEATGMAHPFHIHVNPFQLTEFFSPGSYIDGGAVPASARASVTNGSPEVSGSADSDFQAWFRVGDIINIAGGQGGTIAKITDRSNMTLTQNATATVGNAIYTRLIPQYTVDEATKREGQCYLNPDKPETWKPCEKAEPEPETQRVWWDVFPIPSNKTFTTTAGKSLPIAGYFKMRTRFADYPGYFVLHCHILSHEDRGMMTVVEVTPGTPPKQSPYEHH